MENKYIAAVTITVIFVIILLIYLTSFANVSKDIIIFALTVLEIVSLFFLYFSKTSEPFYFEVSPQRKKCLMEQVSLNPTHSRPCRCCQKGTVGGYPPYYTDWLIPEGENELWKRTDNYTTNPMSDAYKTQIPPVEYVRKIKI